MNRDPAERGRLGIDAREFGRSVLGAPLEVFIPSKNDSDLLVVAGQHGDEPETTTFLSSALRTLAPDALRVPLVLALNPDGLARGTRCNSRGVDLNRNFPTENWSLEDICYRWSDDSPRDVVLNTGDSPGSEPETQAFLSLIEDLKPRTVVTLHAPLKCVDDPESTELGKWLADKCELPLVEDIGYPTPGSFGTWGKENKLSIITFELPHGSIEEHRNAYLEPFLDLLAGKAGIQ